MGETRKQEQRGQDGVGDPFRKQQEGELWREGTDRLRGQGDKLAEQVHPSTKQGEEPDKPRHGRDQQS